MTWEMLIPIIARYGLPVAEAIYKKWASGAEPTDADFTELRGLASEDAAALLKGVLASKGIPLDSDKAKTLLALVQ